MLWLSLLLGASAGFCAYLLHKYNYVRQVWLSLSMPGPLAWPLIGNGLLFANKSAIENFTVMRDLITDFGDVVRVWIGPDLQVFLANPKDVEVLLASSKTINKSTVYNFIKPWLGEGLLISEGKKWHQRRKILTPAFHFKILEPFVEVFDRQSAIMLQKLAQFRPDEKVEMYPIVTLYALDVICETAMGTSVNAQTNSNSEYVRAVKEMSHVIHLRMFDFVLRIDALFVFSKLYRTMHSTLRILHGFTDRVIRERREQLIADGANGNHETAAAQRLAGDSEIGTKTKMNFLDILLQSSVEGRPLSDLDIREEVDTFMFEGHDTTTSGITFGLYNIAKHPEVQRKCVEEIRRVLGDNPDKAVTLQDLNEMHYLEMVIKESLRLYPSVPIIGRTIREELDINGRLYPAGCNFILAIFSMGRSPALWDEPLEFRPERFDAEKSSTRSNAFTYIPFSAGPRNCIGQKFAMLELKSVLSKVLRHYEIELAADSLGEPEMIAELILVPASKINFHLKKRVM